MTGPITLTLTGPRFSSNDRHHWGQELELKKYWRELAQITARSVVGASFRPLEKTRVVVTQVPGSRRITDPGNTSPAAKAAIDGIVLAGVLVNDDAAHMLGPDYRLADQPVRQQPGQWTLRITITELDPAATP